MNTKLSKSLLKSLPIGAIYCKNTGTENNNLLDSVIIESNAIFEKIVNIETDEIVGKTINHIINRINKNNEKCFNLNINIIKNNPHVEYYEILGKIYKLDIIFQEKNHFIIYFMDLTNEYREKEQASILIDNIDKQIWSLQDPTRYGFANKAHADFLGLRKEDIEYNSIYNFLSEKQAKIYSKTNRKVFENKKTILIKDWVVNSNNENRLLEIEKKPVFNNKGEIKYVLCSTKDITEKESCLSDKEVKERILYSMIDFTQELLTNEDSNDALSNGITMLGNATKVDRVYYWESYFDEISKDEFINQVFEWSMGKTPEDTYSFPNKKIPLSDLGEFANKLSKDKPFMTHTKDLKEENKDMKLILEEHEVLSILILPIFISGEFHGFIGFDSCTVEREWSEVEISLLSSFALLYKKSLEREFLEKHVDQMKKNFSNLYKMINDFVFVFDLDGKLLYVNNTVLNRLGYSQEELIGNKVYKLYPKNKKNEVRESIDNIIQENHEYNTIPGMTKDGQLVPVETSLSNGLWNDEEVLFGVSKDMSLLKLSEEKFSRAFNNTAVSMLITECDTGKIIEINETFLDLIGYTKDEIINKKLLDLNLFNDSSHFEETRKLIIENQGASNIELEFRCKNGSIRNGLNNITPITINNKKCMLSSIVDITERRRIMQELAKAKEKSDRSNKEKGRFLSHMSHEIRTPMNAVIGYSDLLSTSDINLQQSHYLSGIKTSSSMLMNIINDILDWSKIDNNKFELSYTSFSLDDCIDNVLNQVEFEDSTKSLTILVEKDDNLPNLLYGDPLRLQQVLLNLVANSVRFTSDGSITIGIRKISNLNESVKLEFRVEDTGIGMPKEKLEDIFNPFQQVDNTSFSYYGGTGLGLSISKEIVGLMNGEIYAESKLDEGSTFYFTAEFDENLSIEDSNDKRLQYFNGELSKGFYSLLEGIKVLIVDDNKINLDLLEEILLSKNMIVTKAINGFQAIEFVENNEYDIILMDIRMPEIDGYETSEIIRKTKDSNVLPIIAVTASASPDEYKRCIARDINDCITKPIEKNILFQRIIELTGEEEHRNIFSNNELLFEDDEKSSFYLDSQIPDEFQDIYGINIKAALDYFEGKKEFLINTLEKFKTNNISVVNNIRYALIKNDIDLATRLAHSLKGISGQLFADNLYDIASQIENNLNRYDLNVEKLLIQLQFELDKTFKSFMFFESDQEENTVISKEINKPKVEELLEKTKNKLLEYDMDSKKYIEKIKNITKQTIIFEDVLIMQKYVEKYDFENALAILEIISTKINKEV